MLSALRPLLLAGVLLAAIPARGDDPLPRLPSASQENLPAPSSNSMSDQTISVTCYLGNPNNQQTMGSIMANGPNEAGSTCNSLYYACRGGCFGCYADFDFSDDVCVDGNGRKYLR